MWIPWAGLALDVGMERLRHRSILFKRGAFADHPPVSPRVSLPDRRRGPLALIPSPSYWWGTGWAARSVLRSYCSVGRAPPVACFQENRVEETFGEVLPPPSSFGCNVATPPPATSS